MLKADAKPLAAAISKVLPVVERRSSIPILAHARLVTKDGRLTISGSDLDVQIDATVGVEQVGPDASTTADPHLLRRLLRSLTGEVVSLTVEDRELVVSWSDGRAALPALRPKNFPEMEPAGERHVALLPPTFVSEILDPVRHCISTEGTRYYLNGVVFDRDSSGRAVLGATDGHRLRVAPAPMLDELLTAAGNARPIITRAVVSLWRDVAFGKEAVLTLYARGEDAAKQHIPYVAIETDGVRIIGKTIDGAFPAWQRIVPATPEHTVTFQRGALLLATQRLAIVSGAGKNDRQNLEIRIEGGIATLSTTSTIRGRIECSIPCEGSFQAPVGFSITYLAAAVQRARGPLVSLSGTAASDPHLLTGSGDPEGTTMVLMPLRVASVASEQQRRAA